MKNQQKGFIAPLLLALIALLLIGGGVYVYEKNKQVNLSITASSTAQTTQTTQSSNQTVPIAQTSNSQTAGWKTYANNQYGFSFQYPSYLGDVVIASSSPPYCPLMREYSRFGVIDGTRTVISFSKNPPIGNTGSYMEYYIPVVQKAKNNADLCGTDLLSLASSFATDSRYTSSVFQQNNSIETYKSTLGGVIDTEADMFYTLFPNTGMFITVMQPKITFIPYANSVESVAIDQIINKLQQAGNSTGNSAIATFINEQNYYDKNLNNSAAQIRGYLADFEQLVQSIKFNSGAQSSMPVDNYSSQYPDASQMP